jgi:hypothetical protein
MTINDFATKYKVKVRRDADDGTDIIPGTHDQSHTYEWSDTELAVMFITPSHRPPSTHEHSFGGSSGTPVSQLVCDLSRVVRPRDVLASIRTSQTR